MNELTRGMSFGNKTRSRCIGALTTGEFPLGLLTSALTLLRASCSSKGKPRTCRLSPL